MKVEHDRDDDPDDDRDDDLDDDHDHPDAAARSPPSDRRDDGGKGEGGGGEDGNPSRGRTSSDKLLNDLHPLCSEIERLVSLRSRHRRRGEWDAADDLKRRLEGPPYRADLVDLSDGTTTWKTTMVAASGEGSKTTARREVVWEELPTNDFGGGRGRGGAGSDDVADEGGDGDGENDDDGPSAAAAPVPVPVPVVIVTVDSPLYRPRLDGTIPHLRSAGFDPRACHMLDVDDHPNLGPRRILSEGWRTVLLPKLITATTTTSTSTEEECSAAFGEAATIDAGKEGISFVLVAEDDVRLAHGTDARGIVRACAAAFRSDPDLDVLSLGHAWGGLGSSSAGQKGGKKREKPKRNQQSRGRNCQNTNEGKTSEEGATAPDGGGDDGTLLSHLRSGGGVHGTTLLAIRRRSGSNYDGPPRPSTSPSSRAHSCRDDGASRLLSALDGSAGCTRNNRQTHFDQFLFCSARHDLGVCLSDPPMVGWAETETTLTSAGPGHRRRGGGRKEFLPPPLEGVKDYEGEETTRARTTTGVMWVRRRLMSKPDGTTEEDA